HFESGIAFDLHILFPRVVAGKTRLAVARITRSGGAADCFAANRETLDQFAVQPYIQLLRPAHAFQIILILALETNLNGVLAFDGEVVRNRQPAAGSEWQV